MEVGNLTMGGGWANRTLPHGLGTSPGNALAGGVEPQASTGNATTLRGVPLVPAYLLNLRHVALVLYLVTFVFGIVGNTLTILVIVKNKRMKTVATCFILNLAVADDLFMLSLPFMAHSTYTGNWVFGSGMCKIMSALYKINLYASIFTMVLMSIDRYLAIVHPLRSIRYRTVKNAMVVCACMWMVCVIIMTPYWLYARTSPPLFDQTHSCKVFWPRSSQVQHKLFWTNFELVIGFILPIVIMVVCYLQLLRHLLTDNGPAQDQTKKPIKKVTVMVFVVTIVFIICWTPYHIVRYSNAEKIKAYALQKSPPTKEDIRYFAIFNTVAQALIFLSSCCNPFIYGISSRNFRKLYLAAVCKCCAPSPKRPHFLPPTTSCINRSVAFDKVHETLIGLDASNDGYVGFERLQISTNGVVESSS